MGLPQFVACWEMNTLTPTKILGEQTLSCLVPKVQQLKMNLYLEFKTEVMIFNLFGVYVLLQVLLKKL